MPIFADPTRCPMIPFVASVRGFRSWLPFVACVCVFLFCLPFVASVSGCRSWLPFVASVRGFRPWLPLVASIRGFRSRLPFVASEGVLSRPIVQAHCPCPFATPARCPGPLSTPSVQARCPLLSIVVHRYVKITIDWGLMLGSFCARGSFE